MNGHIIRGTNIAVDFWKVQGRQESYVHFLTHLHGDHVVGLTSSWRRPIYCSAFTAVLLEQEYGILSSFLEIVPLNQSIIINVPPHESFCVTAFDANHCPGAVMFYFEGVFGNIFYTGDFRASPKVIRECQYLSGKIDSLYLDNTFCSPKCTFPSRVDCFKEIVKVCQQHPKHNIVIGVRSLGKESLLGNLGVVLDESITVSSKCYKIAMMLYSSNVFTTTARQGESTRLWTLPVHNITSELINNLSKEKQTIAIIPTALYSGLDKKHFTFDPNIYIIPYSDHSNYEELVQFVSVLRPAQVIPIITNPKGPFGTSLRDRNDMSCFDSLLSSQPQTNNEDSQEKSMLLTNNSTDQHEEGEELLSCQENQFSSYSYCFTKNKNSLQSPYFSSAVNLQRNTKRKKRFLPFSCKKKAKGVVFENVNGDDFQSTNDVGKTSSSVTSPCENESIYVRDDENGLDVELDVSGGNDDNHFDPAYEEQNLCNKSVLDEVDNENRSRQNNNDSENLFSLLVKVENEFSEDSCRDPDQRIDDLNFDTKPTVESCLNNSKISSDTYVFDNDVEEIKTETKPDVSLPTFDAVPIQNCDAQGSRHSVEPENQLAVSSNCHGLIDQESEDCFIVDSPRADLDLKIEQNDIDDNGKMNADNISVVDGCEIETNNACDTFSDGSLDSAKELSPCPVRNKQCSSKGDYSTSSDEDDSQSNETNKTRYICSCQTELHPKSRRLWGNRATQESKRASVKNPNLSDSNFLSFVQIFFRKK